MSKMTIYNECTSFENYTKLRFVEFLEFLGRLAWLKYKQEKDWSFKEKCEALFDEIFFKFELERNEVTVDIQEVSESDNDY